MKNDWAEFGEVIKGWAQPCQGTTSRGKSRSPGKKDDLRTMFPMTPFGWYPYFGFAFPVHLRINIPSVYSCPLLNLRDHICSSSCNSKDFGQVGRGVGLGSQSLYIASRIASLFTSTMPGILLTLAFRSSTEGYWFFRKAFF